MISLLLDAYIIRPRWQNDCFIYDTGTELGERNILGTLCPVQVSALLIQILNFIWGQLGVGARAPLSYATVYMELLSMVQMSAEHAKAWISSLKELSQLSTFRDLTDFFMYFPNIWMNIYFQYFFQNASLVDGI